MSACQNCTFWTGDRKDHTGQGECHRYPPQMAGVVPVQNIAGQQGMQLIAGYPGTKAANWCGEWQAEIELQ